MGEKRRIPYSPEELTPDQVHGLIPDGQYQGMNEFTYPDYPDLPYPDTVERWDYNKDPLIQNEEVASNQEVWDPEDPHAPWREPHFKY